MRRIHAEDDTDLLLVDLNPFDQRANDLSTRQPIGFVQSCLDPSGKLIETTQDQPEFSLQTRFIFHLLGLCFHLLQAFSHTCHPGFKLLFVDESLRITVNQAGNALPQSPDPYFEVREFIRRLLLLKQTSSILLLKSLRVFQKLADLLPDCLIDEVGSQLLVPAQPHPTKPVGIRANTAIIRIGARMAFTSAWADRFSIISIPATGTDNQALQQIACSTLGDASPLSVFL